MDVIFYGQAEMAGSFGVRLRGHVFATAQKFHDTEGKIRESQRIRLTSSYKKSGESFRIRINGQVVAQLFREGLEPVPSLGRVHYTSNRRETLCFQAARRCTVCGDHEVFNESARAILLFVPHSYHLSVNDDCSSLNCLEVERSFFMSSAVQPPGDFILNADLFIETFDTCHRFRNRTGAVEPCRHAV